MKYQNKIDLLVAILKSHKEPRNRTWYEVAGWILKKDKPWQKHSFDVILETIKQINFTRWDQGDGMGVFAFLREHIQMRILEVVSETKKKREKDSLNNKDSMLIEIGGNGMNPEVKQAVNRLRIRYKYLRSKNQNTLDEIFLMTKIERLFEKYELNLKNKEEV